MSETAGQSWSLEEQQEIEDRSSSVEREALRDWRWVLARLLWIAAAVMLAVHYVHLRADFPNFSPWSDWSKYTDEGWYGDAAIRHFQRGYWYLSGDFNSAVAMPVFPVIEGFLFAVTGVSLVVARAFTVTLLVLTVIFSGILVRQWSGVSRKKTSLAAPVVMLLLSASPFFYSFVRMAIVEPLLVLWIVLTMLAATSARNPARRWLPAIALGVLFPVMVLTKTTAAFLLPAVVWMLWTSCGWSWRRFREIGIPAALIAAVLWGSYMLLVVRPYHMEDYYYLFAANKYTAITWPTAWTVTKKMFQDGTWMGALIYPLGMLACIISIPTAFRRNGNPLVGTLLLWIGGYMFFLTYHANLQPRYYLVVALPVTMLVPLVAEQYWQKLRGYNLRGAEAFALTMAAIFAVAIWRDARQTMKYVGNPEYTLVHAFEGVATLIRHEVAVDPKRSPLVLSISGSDMSLVTGLPAICDDFGVLPLPERIAKYRPGWFVAWNKLEDDKMEALTPLYRPVRVAEFPAMDDPDRNLLIVYRLDPLAKTPFHGVGAVVSK